MLTEPRVFFKKNIRGLALVLGIGLILLSGGKLVQAQTESQEVGSPKPTEAINLINDELNDTGILDALNPLKMSSVSDGSGTADTSSLGTIITSVLNIFYPVATIILFILLLWGGIELLIAGTSGQSATADRAKKRIMAAIIGFVIVIGSALILNIIQAVLGIQISGISSGA